MARRLFHNLAEIRVESKRDRLGQVLQKDMLLKFGPVIAFDLAQATTKHDWFLECPLFNSLLGPAVAYEICRSNMLLGCSDAGKRAHADWALVGKHT